MLKFLQLQLLRSHLLPLFPVLSIPQEQYLSGSQSVAPRSAASALPEKLVEIQIFESCPDLLIRNWELGGPLQSVF